VRVQYIEDTQAQIASINNVKAQKLQTNIDYIDDLSYRSVVVFMSAGKWTPSCCVGPVVGNVPRYAGPTCPRHGPLSPFFETLNGV
jgi:hypothetical protein